MPGRRAGPASGRSRPQNAFTICADGDGGWRDAVSRTQKSRALRCVCRASQKLFSSASQTGEPMKQFTICLALAALAMAQSPKPDKPVSGLSWLVGGVRTADASKLGPGMQRIETRYQWSDNDS